MYSLMYERYSKIRRLVSVRRKSEGIPQAAKSEVRITRADFTPIKPHGLISRAVADSATIR